VQKKLGFGLAGLVLWSVYSGRTELEFGGCEHAFRDRPSCRGAAPYRPFVSKVSVISNVQTPIAADALISYNPTKAARAAAIKPCSQVRRDRKDECTVRVRVFVVYCVFIPAHDVYMYINLLSPRHH